MSISGVSGSSGAQATQASNFQQRRTEFQDLSKALQSGDLSGAQSAFQSLTANSPAAGGNSKIADAFKAVGQALQSGDVAGAQKAFASLQSTLQGAHGHHHHHGGGASASGGAASSTTIPANVSTDSTINVTA
jgi:hypothetical protein